MAKRLTILEFFKKYPDETTCLDHLMNVRYGKHSECQKCHKDSTFYKIGKRPAYACEFCGHHIYPMAGTPFEATRTPLQMWFYAIYLFTTTKHGVPAKELQRQLGVTYKTAWRMGHKIREFMAKVDGDDGLSGHVEVDETYIGGRDKTVGRPGKNSNKTAVFGMIERGGDIMTHVVPDAKTKTLIPLIKENVAEGSTISSDDWRAYRKLPHHGFKHGYVKHQNEQWVNGIHHTNSIEGFWSQLKRSIRGTHIHVSRKHLPKYLGEFEFRYNLRHLTSDQMLDRLLQAF